VNRRSLSVPAKINLHLQVLRSRKDDFHEVWTLFQSIDLEDELEATDWPGRELMLDVEPVGAAPSNGDNLVLAAAAALREATNVEKGARLRLRKRIPARAGLGGGSADAAAALVVLDGLWGTRLSCDELAALAARIGSDVTFFLHGGLAVGSGRGEIVERLPDLPSLAVVVVVPPCEVSTPWAFAERGRRLTSRGPDATVEAFVAARRTGRPDVLPWSALFNDFEEVVTAQWSDIKRAIRSVRATRPLHAGLTGTGAAVFGVYADSAAARCAAHEIGNEWRVHIGSTLGRSQAGLLGDRTGFREEERSWK
jgi:4-diphosphocytidyl-2-C-methyl-D-erythritol kinase